VVPKIEGIVSGVAIAGSGEAMAVGTKQGVDLIMGSAKSLSMMG